MKMSEEEKVINEEVISEEKENSKDKAEKSKSA